MNIAICDDDTKFLDTISISIEKWAKKHHLKLSLYRFTNGDKLLSFVTVKNECIDLIFLDVIMPLLNGIETAKELRNTNQTVPIIFLTTSKEFAVDSYEVKAFHYLIKPIVEEKLFTVLDDFLITFKKPHEIFIAQTSFGFCKINVSNIDYLEAQNKHVNVHLCNGTTIEIRELFSKCETFFSIEKGFF